VVEVRFPKEHFIENRISKGSDISLPKSFWWVLYFENQDLSVEYLSRLYESCAYIAERTLIRRHVQKGKSKASYYRKLLRRQMREEKVWTQKLLTLQWCFIFFASKFIIG
jgi:hypothetical protein